MFSHLLKYKSRSRSIVMLEEQTHSFSIETFELLGLTRRESEVLFWATKGQNNHEITSTLGCSSATVKKHLDHIYKKFGMQSRLAAVVYA